jgi:hypothetical protein
VQAALRADPALAGALAARLLENHFPESLHPDILAAVGLDLGAPLTRIIQSLRRAAAGREPSARGSGHFGRDRPFGHTTPLPPCGEGTATGCPEG